MSKKKYLSIISHYEECFRKHGDNFKGVDWPNEQDANIRYKVMLDILKKKNQDESVITLLDFGCGASHFCEYIINRGIINNIHYHGLDISDDFIKCSQKKFPNNIYYCMDILDGEYEHLPSFDYIIMNGVFTEKRNLSFEEMFSYFKEVIYKVFQKVNVGIAFNVMSKQVDWVREDLFHLPLDTLANFLTKEISRHFIIRNDYGLYEYTTYLYKESQEN